MKKSKWQRVNRSVTNTGKTTMPIRLTIDTCVIVARRIKEEEEESADNLAEMSPVKKPNTQEMIKKDIGEEIFLQKENLWYFIRPSGISSGDFSFRSGRHNTEENKIPNYVLQEYYTPKSTKLQANLNKIPIFVNIDYSYVNIIM